LDAGQCREIEALVFAFVPAPICTHTYQAAMRLAEHCDPMPCAPVAGYWSKVCLVRMVDGLFVCTQQQSKTLSRAVVCDIAPGHRGFIDDCIENI
jgi:hypothetical protein